MTALLHSVLQIGFKFRSQFQLLPQIRCLIFGVHSGTITIDHNITDIIIRKVINVQQEKCRTKNGPLWKSSINWIFLRKLPMENHPKPPITEKRNSISLTFVKKTSMPNSIKHLGYIKCCSFRPILGENSIRYIKIALFSRFLLLQLVSKSHNWKKCSFLSTIVSLRD